MGHCWHLSATEPRAFPARAVAPTKFERLTPYPGWQFVTSTDGTVQHLPTVETVMAMQAELDRYRAAEPRRWAG